jgi:hypothetical protein
VFDTVGNDGIKAQIEETQTALAAEEEPSLLSLVEEGEATETETVVEEIEEPEVVEEILEEEDPAVVVEEVQDEEVVPAELAEEEVVAPEVVEEEQPEIAAEVEEEQQVVAVEIEEPEVEDLVEPEEVPETEIATEAEEEVEAEKAEVIVAEVEPEKAPALAAMADVDPVLATDPKKLGETEEAKEKALGAEGKKHVEEAVAAATASLGAGALDDAAKDLITKRLTDQLDSADIVEARQDNRLDELVQEAIRDNALRSRDEVIAQIQQVIQDPNTLAKLAGSGDIAVGLIEHLATKLGEVEDLVALAAYDHADLQKKVLMTDKALHVRHKLSPMAARMGGFASVLYQMVGNELDAHPLPDVGGTVAAEGETPPEGAPSDAGRADVLRADLLAVNNLLRLSRTAAA